MLINSFPTLIDVFLLVGFLISIVVVLTNPSPNLIDVVLLVGFLITIVVTLPIVWNKK